MDLELKRDDEIKYMRTRKADGVGRCFVYSVDEGSIRVYIKVGGQVTSKQRYFSIRPEQVLGLVPPRPVRQPRQPAP